MKTLRLVKDRWKVAAIRVLIFAHRHQRHRHDRSDNEEDLEALLLGAAAMNSEPLSFLMPARHARLFRWCYNWNRFCLKS